MLPRRLLTALAASVVLAALPYGCAASSKGDSGSGAGNGTGGTPTAGGSGGLGGIGVGQGGGVGGSNTCAAETFSAEPAPLDLYVLLDQSLSMADDGKWDSVLSALQSFIADPSSTGVGMGLMYFPVSPLHPPPTNCDGSNPNDPTCGLYGPCLGSNVCFGSYYDDSCSNADYQTPEIPIASLPGIGSTINASLAAHSPPDGGTTPSQPAVEGAIQYAAGWAAANPTHVTVVVLATDGDPSNCSSNTVAGTAAAVEHAFGGTPPVKTFVVGVGSQLGSLNLIAEAGGTGEAFIVDTAADVAAQFAAAMTQIRSTGQCLVGIPDPQVGAPDYGKVNVEIADPSGNEPAIELANVGDADGCDPVEGGWYYDDPDDPERIFLCPASCADVTGVSWDVEVLLGCETIVK
jgi:hypothetical protein